MGAELTPSAQLGIPPKGMKAVSRLLPAPEPCWLSFEPRWLDAPSIRIGGDISFVTKERAVGDERSFWTDENDVPGVMEIVLSERD